jgi:hypothetical protein
MKVTAATKEEALEKVREEACVPHVCHHCSSKIDMGDIDLENLTIDCVEEL